MFSWTLGEKSYRKYAPLGRLFCDRAKRQRKGALSPPNSWLPYCRNSPTHCLSSLKQWSWYARELWSHLIATAQYDQHKKRAWSSDKQWIQSSKVHSSSTAPGAGLWETGFPSHHSGPEDKHSWSLGCTQNINEDLNPAPGLKLD